MKKLIVIAGALALAACGNDAETPAEADTTAAETGATTNTAAFDEYGSAGTYGGTTEDGTSWSSVLNEDGTFEDTEAGETIRTGTWSDDPVKGTCFVPEGETAEECYQMGDVGEDGTVVVTGPDGAEFTMQKQS